MRNLRLLDRYRISSMALWGTDGDDKVGRFIVASPLDRGDLRVIATSGEQWDHVSVSRHNRCPNWAEMEHVKRLFFNDDETAMQLHVPTGDHVNYHPYCLHLWRPLHCEIPRPPDNFVGPTNAIERQMADRMLAAAGLKPR